MPPRCRIDVEKLRHDLGVKDVPTVPVRVSCLRCREAPVRHVYFPDVSYWCEKCGQKVHVTLMPLGVCYVTRERPALR